MIADLDVDAAPPMPPQAPPRSAEYIPDAAELPRMWPTTWLEVAIVAAALAVWVADGRPGLDR